MNNVVINPYEYFADPTKGRPIFNGFVYIGLPDTDPEVPANQKQVYARQEDGNDVSIPQPVLTNAGGYPTYNGSVVIITVQGPYSVKVNDKQGNQLLYQANATLRDQGALPLLAPRAIGDGIETVFASSATAYASPNYFTVTLDGVKQRPVTDYDIDLNGNVVLVSPAPFGAKVDIIFYNADILQVVSSSNSTVTATPSGVSKTLGEWTEYLATPETIEVTATGTTTARSLADRFGDSDSLLDYGAIDAADNTYPAQLMANNGEVRSSIDSILSGYISKPSGELIIDGGAYSVPAAGGFSAHDLIRCRIKNTDISRTTQNSATTGSIISMYDVDDVVISDTTINGIDGTGSAILIYSSDGVNKCTNVTIKDVSVSGNIPTSLNTNGVLVESGDGTIFSNIRANGIREYAVELKNETRNSVISNIIATDSKTGLGFGQTTPSTDDVSYTAVSNAVLRGNDFGVFIGDAHNNNFTGLQIDATGRPVLDSSVGTGIRLAGVSTGNTFYAVSMTGSSMAEPVRYGGSSSLNFTQVSLLTDSATMIIHEAGSTKNVTDVSTINGTSIRTKINNVSGNPISGASANPTFCHATGEYVGIFGPYWLWQYSEVSGVTPASYQKWIFEHSGQAFVGIKADNMAGYSVTNSIGTFQFSVSSAGDYMSMNAPTWGIRMYSSTMRPTSDNVMSLGAASFRYNTVYAGTGTINTSDERLKTDLIDIDDAEIACAREVKSAIKKYKMLDSVSVKGEEKARWHFGVGAQTVIDIFRKHGLDPFIYGLVCYDKWEYQPAECDDDGNETSPEIQAGDRYGIRYDELAMFIIAAI